MNKTQKIIVALFLPIIVIMVVYVVGDKALDRSKLTNQAPLCDVLEKTNPNTPCNDWVTTNVDVSAFDFGNTWWVWLLAIAVIFGTEMYIFRDSKK